MGVIKRLPDTLVSQIAAGEVIESPVGLVKELVENSLDAAADRIQVFIRGFGFESIQVRDNGVGISKDDLPLAIQSYATSKLNRLEDIFNISSLGFRGEALSSIRSVSRMRIESRHEEAEQAYAIVSDVDEIEPVVPCALPEGTRIIISDLFYNAPIRRQFFKNTKKLKKEIIELITGFALSHPGVAFELVIDDETSVKTTQARNLLERIEQLFGVDFAEGLVPVYWQENNKTLTGYISNFSFYKSNASHIRLFINNRQVQFKKLVGLLRHIYGELLPPGRFPIAFIHLEIPSEAVDVNIHPQKKEIRFREENEIDTFLRIALRHAIEGQGPLQVKRLHHPAKPVFQTENAAGEQTFISTSTNEEQPKSKKPLLKPESLDKAAASISPENPLIDPERKPTNPWAMTKQAHARLFRTFVLASSEHGVYLIDQHTAHERINYEKFLKRLREGQKTSQELLAPVSLNLTKAEASLLSEHIELLHTLGFEVEDMGPAGFSLTAIPFYIDSGHEDKALTTALQLIEQADDASTIDAQILFNEMAANLACRSSVKKGDDESVPNLAELIAELEKCENPGRCPHGRPTMVFLGRDQVFQLFKRRPD